MILARTTTTTTTTASAEAKKKIRVLCRGPFVIKRNVNLHYLQVLFLYTFIRILYMDFYTFQFMIILKSIKKIVICTRRDIFYLNKMFAKLWNFREMDIYLYYCSDLLAQCCIVFFKIER